MMFLIIKIKASVTTMGLGYINFLLAGVVDGLIVCGSWILAVLENKQESGGMFQLLGAMIKVWTMTTIYPIGKWYCLLKTLN